ERLPTNHHFVENRAQGKQVRTQVDGFSANLFGRTIGHKPSQPFSRLRFDQAHVGDAVAEEFNQPIPLHQDLGGLERTMGHTFGGGLFQSGANLTRDVEQIPDGEAFFARQHGSDTVALDVLHGGAELAVDLARAIKHNDILSGKIARALALGNQRFHKRIGALAEWLQTLRLKRYHLVGFRVQRLINKSGLGLRKFTLDLEPAKHRRHCYRLAVTSRTTPDMNLAENRGRIELRIPLSAAPLRVTKVPKSGAVRLSIGGHREVLRIRISGRLMATFAPRPC